MLQSIERYMKQAIVDRLPSISSAALVSSLHIAGAGNPNAAPAGKFVNELVVNDLSYMTNLLIRIDAK
jgi:coatomer protein complex subunit gamma